MTDDSDMITMSELIMDNAEKQMELDALRYELSEGKREIKECLMRVFDYEIEGVELCQVDDKTKYKEGVIDGLKRALFIIETMEL